MNRHVLHCLAGDGAPPTALTGPVVTWMIGNHVSFLADASKPYALGGLIGGLFFAGYMLTQWPGGYLGSSRSAC
jgi:MFS transporter, ACS family, D-galactonate transporter